MKDTDWTTLALLGGAALFLSGVSGKAPIPIPEPTPPPEPAPIPGPTPAPTPTPANPTLWHMPDGEIYWVNPEYVAAAAAAGGYEASWWESLLGPFPIWIPRTLTPTPTPIPIPGPTPTPTPEPIPIPGPTPTPEPAFDLWAIASQAWMEAIAYGPI